MSRISGIAKLAQDKGNIDASIATRFLLGTTDGAAHDLMKDLLQQTLADN